jgi:prophage regulatory protein
MTKIIEGASLPDVPERLLRIKEVLSITGLSRSRLYALIKEGKFAEPFALGEGSRTVAWIASEVNDWVAHQIAVGRAKRGGTPIYQPKESDTNEREVTEA